MANQIGGYGVIAPYLGWGAVWVEALTIQALFHRTMYWLYTRQRVDADYYSFAVICTLLLGAVVT